MLSLGGQTGRRATAHNVDNHQRQFSHYSQADAFALKSQTGTRSRSNGKVACKCSTDSRANAGYFVFHLASLHAEVLALGEFVKNVGGRGDRVAAEEQWAAALFRSHNEAPSGGFVAIDVGVDAGLCSIALDAVGRNRSVNVVTVVITALHHLGVGFVDGGFLGKLVLEHVKRAFERAVEEPAHKAERKHIAALEGSFVVETTVGECCLDERSHRHFHYLSTNLGESDFIVRCVGGIERFVEVGFLKRIDVDDSHATFLEEFYVLLKRSSVHRNEHIALVAGSVNPTTNVNLKSRNAIERTLRSANFGRIVGESGDLIANAG